MSHDHVLLIRHLDLREEGIQWQTTVLMDGVVGRPESGTFGCEGIDRPIILVPYSFITVIKSIEEIRIIHVKFVGTDANYWTRSRFVSNSGIAHGVNYSPYCLCSSAILKVYWPLW